MMSRFDGNDVPDYDFFLVKEVMATHGVFAGTPVQSRNGKSALLAFSEFDDVEVWVAKKIAKIKDNEDGTFSLMIPTWWTKKQEELK